MLSRLSFALVVALVPAAVLAESADFWTEVEPGFSVGRYDLSLGDKVLKSEVFLLKFNPKLFTLRVVEASSVYQGSTDIRTLTKRLNGVAGINAHFFDTAGSPLGLLVSEGKMRQKIHWGGNLLTGIFLLQKDWPLIIHRDEFGGLRADEALQSGPRLVSKGKAVAVSSMDGANRRSGIARTGAREVILYATFLRFPGATLKQIQQMLLDPILEITDALNLDGGGSSQLFIERNGALAEETFISGGDAVPVGLIVKRKNIS